MACGCGDLGVLEGIGHGARIPVAICQFRSDHSYATPEPLPAGRSKATWRGAQLTSLVTANLWADAVARYGRSNPWPAAPTLAKG